LQLDKTRVCVCVCVTTRSGTAVSTTYGLLTTVKPAKITP